MPSMEIFKSISGIKVCSHLGVLLCILFNLVCPSSHLSTKMSEFVTYLVDWMECFCFVYETIEEMCI